MVPFGISMRGAAMRLCGRPRGAVASLVCRNGTLKLSRSCERIREAVVELAYLVAVETFVFDLKVHANQHRRRNLFDRQADRLRCRVETSISNRPALAAAGGQESPRAHRNRSSPSLHSNCSKLVRDETTPGQARSRAPPAREARRPS